MVDASVAAKWLFPKVGSQAAQSLLTHANQLSAPALVRIEVYAPSPARYKACELWAGAVEKGVLSLVADEEILPAAVDLALQLAHPLQDCLYLALAEREQAVLITQTRSSRRGRKRHMLRSSCWRE